MKDSLVRSRLGKMLMAGALFAAFSTATFATSVNGTGAGSLPGSAADFTYTGVTEIYGQIAGNMQDPTNAVNVFKFNIYNPQSFSAQSIDSGTYGIQDTELFLFNSLGQAVYMDDDSLSSSLACLPSLDGTNQCSNNPDNVGPLTKGVYYLAITSAANLPVDSLANLIFSTANGFDVNGPDATNGGNAIAGWNNGGYTQPNYDLNQYDIVLTGTVPEPGTLGLIGSGAPFALFGRRKLSSLLRKARAKFAA